MRNQIRQRGGKRLEKRRRPMLGPVLVVALSSLALLLFSLPAEGENYQGVQKGAQQSAQAALPSPGWEITLLQTEPSSGREPAKEAEGETEALTLWTGADLELIAQTVWAEARGVESRAEQAYKQTYQQYMTDMFIIALNDPAVMGKDVLGYKRLMRVLLAVEANYDRFFDALTKNAEADYARVKMDAIMQNICPPEKFIPFEKRYEWLPEITYEPRK